LAAHDGAVGKDREELKLVVRVALDRKVGWLDPAAPSTAAQLPLPAPLAGTTL
jgi:hypothetical protein